MKVAVQILSTLKEPSTRNIEAIKNTYIALANSLAEKGKLKHTYDFYFYYLDVFLYTFCWYFFIFYYLFV